MSFDSELHQAQTSGKEVVPKYASSGEVRSATVVQHARVHFSPLFSELQYNTNLNVPPSNWLRSSSKLEQYVRDFSRQREQSVFSSIQMAVNSPTLTGEVDVISDARNIKKLLKMPFSKSHISMMVHRIGESILLDDFDIHKHLLRQEKDDWRWLRQFYYEYVARDIEEKWKCVPRKNKSRNNLQNRNMYSKFLYHSLAESVGPMSIDIDTNQSDVPAFSIRPEQILTKPDEPLEPSNHQFEREILWTFEDIRMLIGTDLPIFCGGAHPCISLRLREMKSPINVLTGLDYWLDNLMCNVPEVAMCYHLNGIVQTYELMKTEEIPDLDDSKFDPQEVNDIARNILSFLKANTTKEGHTYWLYKGVDDDIVKLYDLTDLCAETMDKQDNPFSVPIGMLLYRVARNMRSNFGRKKSSKIRTLLESCLHLLDDRKHSQVYTSASYLLTDLFIPDSVVKDDWSSGSSEDSDEDTDLDDTLQGEEPSDSLPSVDVRTLSVASSIPSTAWDLVPVRPICTDVEERCKEALLHIENGLTSLNCDLIEMMSPTHSSSYVEKQAECNSWEAIPLHYKPLQEFHSWRYTDENVASLFPTDQGTPMPSVTSWHVLSKFLLLRKSMMTFYSLAKIRISTKCGQSLRFIRAALLCYAAMKELLPGKTEENLDLVSTILGLAGDIRFMMVKTCQNQDQAWRDFQEVVEDLKIVQFANEEIINFDYEWVWEESRDTEQNLEKSYLCYKTAINMATQVSSSSESLPSISKRLGNVLNELGVWYMNQSQLLLENDEKTLPLFETATMKSLQQFHMGMELFEEIKDLTNQALLLSNMGKLMRLCAQAHTGMMLAGSKSEFSSRERDYFTKAAGFYQRALVCLKTKEKVSPIWESVSWELSTTYFNMAMLLQDYAPLSSFTRDEIEKEVTDLMNKSLKHCHTEINSPRQPMCQYRAALVNHRLASLYHNSYRQQPNDQRKKYLRHLLETHYDKAARYFNILDCPLELLRVHLEKVAMYEFTLTTQTNYKNRLKILSLALKCFAECKDVVHSLLKQLSDSDLEKKLKSEGDSLMEILISRLQFVFLQLIKLHNKNKKSSNNAGLVTEMKNIYWLSLQQTTQNPNTDSLHKRWKSVVTLLENVQTVYCKSYHKEPG
ncbi:hypothetical protein ScPMuIL_007031 [Solemya velum]